MAKEIVLEIEKLTVNELFPPLGIIVYLRSGSNTNCSKFAMLANLDKRDTWGFIDTEGYGTKPTYINSSGYRSTIEYALGAGKKLYRFDDLQDFVTNSNKLCKR